MAADTLVNGRVPDNFLAEWGTVMRLARRASMLATEDARKKKLITDPEDSAIMLYTDDPTTASWFAASQDTRAVCKTSHLEGVAILMGENFPPASFEAERTDTDMPRVAAMYFPAIGTKCPQCRLYRNATPAPICPACTDRLICLTPSPHNNEDA